MDTERDQQLLLSEQQNKVGEGKNKSAFSSAVE